MNPFLGDTRRGVAFRGGVDDVGDPADLSQVMVDEPRLRRLPEEAFDGVPNRSWGR